MGKVDDYINSLEGQENLDLAEVARTFLGLHNEEVAHVASTSSAKIDQLNSQLSEKDGVIAEKDNSLKDMAAANWDLVNRIPTENNEKPEPSGEGEIDQRRITLDDAFAS